MNTLYHPKDEVNVTEKNLNDIYEKWGSDRRVLGCECKSGRCQLAVYGYRQVPKILPHAIQRSTKTYISDPSQGEALWDTMA